MITANSLAATIRLLGLIKPTTGMTMVSSDDFATFRQEVHADIDHLNGLMAQIAQHLDQVPSLDADGGRR